jgi:CBS domain-containing protein
MQVKDIMTRHPACCTPETSLHTVACLMVEKGCGAIPIVKSPESPILVGIVTDRDIACRIVAQGENPQHISASDCMSYPVFSLNPEASVEECRLAMERHQVRRIPIVEEDGACSGIVSLADIVEWSLYEETARVVMAVSHGPRTASRVAA